MTEDKKFDCRTCRWKGGVPGSVHNSCKHPSLKKSVVNNPAMELMAAFASVGRVPPMNVSSKELNIRGDPHGIKKGWFNFPWNFDPVWLENCDGYEKRVIRR